MARLIFSALLAVVALSPLPLASNRPAGWSLLALAVGLLLVAWAVLALRDGRLVRATGPRAWVPAGLFLVVVAWFGFQASGLGPEAWHHPLWPKAAAALGEPLRSAISVAPGDTVTALMRLMAYGGIFWLALQFGRRDEDALVLIRSVAIAATVYAAYGLVVEFSGAETILWFDKWAYRGALTATFVNRNSFASYAGLGLIAAFGLMLRELRHAGDGSLAERLNERAPAVTGWLVALLILGTALLLTKSRAGFAATALGLAVYILVYGARSGGGWRRRLAGLAGLGVAAGLVIAISGGGTLERIDREGVDSLGARLWLQERTLAAAADAPLTGHGYGTFASFFQAYRDTEHGGRRAIGKAHNSYLEMLAEAGLPATGVLLGLVAWLAFALATGVRRRRRNATYPAIGLGALTLAAAHSWFDFSLQIPAVAAAFALTLGTVYAQSWSTRPRRR